jgi:hypothetical protein
MMVSFLWIYSGRFWRATPTIESSKVAGAVPRRPPQPSQPRDSQEQLCVIVRTIASQRHALPALLLSLFSDPSTRFRVRAVVGDTATPGKQARFADLPHIIAHVNAVLGFEGVVGSNRDNTAVLKEFPRLSTPDFGYLFSDAMIEDVIAAFIQNSPWNGSLLVARRQNVHVLRPILQLARAGWTCEYFLTTNGDNIYAAEFTASVHAALHRAPPPAESPSHQGAGNALFGAHWYSHYELVVPNEVSFVKFLRAGRCGPLRSGRYAESVISQVLRPGCVDLGAVAMRTDFVAMSGYRFFADALVKDPTGKTPLTAQAGCTEQPPAYCADGALFSRLASSLSNSNLPGSGVALRKLYGGLKIVPTALFFHQ